MILHYLPYLHEELPISKKFDIFGARYDITIYYNDRFDIYTIMIYKNNSLLFGGKLTYIRNALDAIVAEIPDDAKIIPLLLEDVLREAPRVKRITKDNFDKVMLTYEII
jgi:hypothetical protein